MASCSLPIVMYECESQVWSQARFCVCDLVDSPKKVYILLLTRTDIKLDSRCRYL